ncbi:sugar transferase, partial [Methylobacterium sp. J-001]|uniref:sugar transferase n=1 Tax=Methylobacterium sp. J-001 TaxID=2836609 RepID=UPI001FB9F9CE
WAGDRKAPIFRHTRLGRDGRSFGCLKFRSMVADGEGVLAAHLAASPRTRAEWAATHKLSDDPRITAIGQVLRKTSLSEHRRDGAQHDRDIPAQAPAASIVQVQRHALGVGRVRAPRYLHKPGPPHRPVRTGECP